MRFVVVVQSLSHVQLFATPWTAARQASLSFTISWSLLKLMSIESVMPSNHLILCCPLLIPPSIFPSIRVFSNEPVPIHYLDNHLHLMGLIAHPSPKTAFSKIRTVILPTDSSSLCSLFIPVNFWQYCDITAHTSSPICQPLVSQALCSLVPCLPLEMLLFPSPALSLPSSWK